MKLQIRIIFFMQILAVLYGIYSEFAPSTWPLRKLPEGMGLALVLVSATMIMTLAVVDSERVERERRAEHWDIFAENSSTCLPLHEREFYGLWPAQVISAKNNIDVTHLGIKPPRGIPGGPEDEYFRNMKRLYKKTSAHVRRVERFTPQKHDWIKQIVSDFTGSNNFSLRVIVDPSDGEMPYTLSVCRIDARCAWLIALAEHESTSNHRDLLITGHDSVDLLTQYFQKRLWDRGIPVIDRGVVCDGWEQKATAS